MAQRNTARGDGAHPTRSGARWRVGVAAGLILAAGACGRGGGAPDPIAAPGAPGAAAPGTTPPGPVGSDPTGTSAPGAGSAADGGSGTGAAPNATPDPGQTPADGAAATAGANADGPGAATASGPAAAPPSTAAASSAGAGGRTGGGTGGGTGSGSAGGAGNPGGQGGAPTTSTSEPPTTGTLTGTIYAGPDCNEVNHSNCPPLANGSVSITGPDLGPDGRPVPTDAAGRFSVTLPPGSYRVDVAQSCSGSTRPLVVEAGGTVTATLWCTGGSI